MRKLSLSILAASVVLVAAPAFAQGHRQGPRPQAGHSWRGGMPGMRGQHRPMPAMRGHHRPNVAVRHGTPRFHGGQRFPHPGRNFRHHRLQRGFAIHPFWFGGQFHINNWQSYGFADPGPDRRWVRYYDDAYLIGRDGRVHDERYGLDWDQYGEQWEVEDGIPAYRGSRDWEPGEEDYAWAESHGSEGPGNNMDGGWDYSQYGHVSGGAYAVPGHGYGHYGYGYAYPIVIETTVTTGQSYTEEVVEEYVEVRRPRRRAVRRARPHCACPAPRPAAHRPAPPRRPPPAGERG